MHVRQDDIHSVVELTQRRALRALYKRGYYRALSRSSAEVARRIGANPEEILEGAGSPEAKQALKEATDAAIARGVFGAPTFFVGEEMYWGNDRLHFVEGALRQS